MASSFGLIATRQAVYPCLVLALDLLSAPESEAYVERIFFLNGMLTAGRQNWHKKNLGDACLPKLNNNILRLLLKLYIS